MKLSVIEQFPCLVRAVLINPLMTVLIFQKVGSSHSPKWLYPNEESSVRLQGGTVVLPLHSGGCTTTKWTRLSQTLQTGAFHVSWCFLRDSEPTWQWWGRRLSALMAQQRCPPVTRAGEGSWSRWAELESPSLLLTSFPPSKNKKTNKQTDKQLYFDTSFYVQF